jgi:hypothetical protein
LANGQLAATLLSAAYVFLLNAGSASDAPPAVPWIGFVAGAFRAGWSYLYVRFLFAPSINRVVARGRASRGRRLAAAFGESLWAQAVDALVYASVGAECVFSVLPFVATNTFSLFASAEASHAGHPPDAVVRDAWAVVRRRLPRRAAGAPAAHGRASGASLAPPAQS